MRLPNSLKINLIWQRIISVTVFFAMAVAVIFPALSQLHSTLPTGPSRVVTVPLFNVWTIGWNIDRMGHLFSGYWDAPIFFGNPGAFAFSEPQPATLLVAPVYWASGSLIVAYKAYLLLSLVLNGVFTVRLCRHLKIQRMWAFAAGAMMVWLPLGLRQIDVLQLIPVWGILWTWDSGWRHCRQPTLRSGISAGIACGVSFGMSIHHGLFMIIVLVPCLLLTMAWRHMLTAWKTNVVAISLSLLLVGSLALPMRSVMKTYQFERSQKLVTNLSARPEQFFSLPKEALIGHSVRGNGFRLSPGWIKLALACVGLVAGLCRRRKRRWVVFLSMIVTLSALLALGPNLKIGGWQPWWLIAKFVPGLQQTRNVFRFFYLTQMGIILLSAMGLSEIWLRLRRATGRPRIATVLAIVAGVVCVFELPPPRPLLAGVPNRNRHHEWASYVKQHTAVGKGIACLPFASGRRVTDFAMTTRWMYYGTLHGVPLINGYSGFFPKAYFSIQESFNETGLTDGLLEKFESAGIDLIVIHRRFKAPKSVEELPLRQFHLKLVFSDDVGIDVYQLRNSRNAAR